MAQPKKRFGRRRDAQDDSQQFTLTEEDRDLTRLVQDTLPRNRATATFERSASRTRVQEESEAGTARETSAGAQSGDEPDGSTATRVRRQERKAQRTRPPRPSEPQPTPLWYKVVMIGLMVVGLLWIIAYYLFQGQLPVPGLDVWNLVIGLAFMLSGLIMTTRWR